MSKTESDRPHKRAESGRIVRELEALWMVVASSSAGIV